MISPSKHQKDIMMNLEDKVSELEKERVVKDSLNSVEVDSILSILRETRLESELINSIFSDAIDKISREKQFLEDSLIQYQLEYIDSLNKTKEAYIDSFQIQLMELLNYYSYQIHQTLLQVFEEFDQKTHPK